MNEKTFIVVDESLSDDLNSVEYVHDVDNALTISHYVEIVRHVQEIIQLFDCFNYFYEELKKSTCNVHIVAVNSNMIGLLSIGKSLIESIEICISNFCSNGERSWFKQHYLSGEYDSNFSYRFLFRLRDYCQHTHIPVGCSTDNFYFDLNQIYSTPHYNFKLEDEVAAFILEVREKYQDECKLAIKPTVVSYVSSIYKIYLNYLYLIVNEINSRKAAVDLIVKENPELIEHKSNRKYRGYLFYRESNDNSFNAFYYESETNRMIDQRINEAVVIEKNESDYKKKLEACLVVK